MRGLKNSDRYTYIVVDRGRSDYQYQVIYGPTTKEDAEYYQGNTPWYELVKLEVVGKRKGDVLCG